jgi:DNA replication protein DnaD
MTRPMFSYTKMILESVSFDPKLFCKEVEKAIKMLLPYEIEELIDWLHNFTIEKPELKACLINVEQ